MASVVVVATLKDVQAPAGTAQGKYLVTVTGSDNVDHSQSVDAPTATFADVAPGDYTASVQAQDSNGGVIGAKATAQFNVPKPADVTVQGADVVTVTVQ